MKGLARETPSSARVQVKARTARKHYGSEGGHIFDSSLHDESKKYAFPSMQISHADKLFKILGRFLWST